MTGKRALGFAICIVAASIVALTSCATTRPGVEEVLETPGYTLRVVAHCAEGEVGCARLTATLLIKANGDSRTLQGTTSMVKCADRVTPCHVGFYDLKAPQLSVRAYPEGALEIQSGGVVERSEHGSWRYQE